MPRSSVTLEIPGQLREYCGGASRVTVDASTVGGALQDLERAYPALYRNICDETGTVRRHINVFVNDAHMRDLDGLDTPLGSSDVLIILPAVSGG